MSLDEAGCLIIFSLIVSFIPIIMGLYYLWRVRTIKKTQTRKIGKLIPGMIEIKGRAYPFPGKDLISPMGNYPCVRYLTKVYSTRLEERGTTIETIEDIRWKEEKGDRFLLKDDSGSVRMSVQYDEFPMKKMICERIEPMGPLSPLLKDFCSRKNIDVKGPLGLLNRDLVFEELILPIGQEIYVLGNAERVPIYRELTTIKGISPYQIILNMDSIISFEGEKDVISRYKIRGIGAIIFGSIMVIISLSFLLWSLIL